MTPVNCFSPVRRKGTTISAARTYSAESKMNSINENQPEQNRADLRGEDAIAKIKELWEPIVKTWFTEGADDPRITAIKVAPAEGYYWDTKHGMAVAGVNVNRRRDRENARRLARRDAHALGPETKKPAPGVTDAGCIRGGNRGS